jgi:hypothetical protein
MRGWSILVGFAIVLSGCVGGESASDPGEDGGSVPIAQGPAAYDENTGGIGGVVTDFEIQPLAGTLVGILGRTDLTVMTDADGRFAFSNLEPGTYNVAANKLGYEAAVARAEVLAGGVTDVHLMLAILPIEEPYTETIIHRGKIEHGLGLIRTATCANCGTAATRYEFKDKVPLTFKGMVIEVEWNTADYLGIDFLDRNDLPSDSGRNKTGVYWRVREQSPVHGFVERCGNYVDNVYFGSQEVPCTDEELENRNWLIENWYVGGFQQETHMLDPACQTQPLNYRQGCYGLGYIPELVYTDYITLFHRELPGDAALFSAIPDG